MSGFISHLVSNHVNPAGNVQPRLKGRFESFSITQQPAQNSFREDYIENGGISNEYNSINQPDQNKTSHKDLHSGIVQNSQPRESIHHADMLNKASPNRLQKANYIHDTPDNSVNNQRENEIQETSLLIAPPISLNVNNTVDNFPPDNNESKKNIETEMLYNHSAINSEDHLLVPPFETKAGSVLTHVIYPEEQKNNDTTFDNYLAQSTANPHQRPDIPVLNTFRQMYKDDTSKNTATEPASVIKVNIGRIDVRAVTQQTPARENIRPNPSMSLDDFLKKKNGSK